MRLRAVLFAALGGLAAGCTEHLVLPSVDPTDGSAADGVDDHFRGHDADTGVACNESPLLSRPRTADLLVLVGRDASMATRFGDGTRMSAVQGALKGAINAYKMAINIGYQDFPPLDGCQGGPTCCSRSAQGSIEPNQYSFMGALQQLQECGGGPSAPDCVAPTDSKPLGGALDDADAVFRSLSDAANDRYVLVLLDGGPSCSPSDSKNACDYAATSIANLARPPAAVNTILVAVGDEAAGDLCLQQRIAPNGGSQLVVAATPMDLSMKVSEIFGDIASSQCTIVLQSVPADVSKVTVRVNGQEIPQDSSGVEGWKFSPGSHTQIVVGGRWCDAIQMVKSNLVTVASGCAPCGENFSCP